MNLQSLVDLATRKENATVAVAAAEDKEVLKAVSMAVEHGMAEFLLFGDREKIEQVMEESQRDLLESARIKIIHSPSVQNAAELAVQAVNKKEADVLMKGHVSTSVLLKAVLNKEWGLRTGNVLSHAAAFEVEGFEKLVFVTDAAMNISPDLGQKAQIIQNTVSVARSIGIDQPKVAPLAAVEVINPQMQATLDAAALTVMNQRGQIKDCLVDGPLALDNAVSSIAARQKGIVSEVAGEADILLVPTIEAGNVLYKSLMYFAGAKVAAVISGATAPIVLTSRSDLAESKLYSLALAICSSENR
ncbi:phosphate butyryltransferase [Rossellomorea marisflavi]|uniref:Phosphate butyryltransferase n=1 Tax=Rossellomorea marisflavi TaxID=189381 RepID=A0A0J5T311_9BACI|nr:phosphate butyryltransferase [Rossellomorea marisflavi]KML01352.1 phosphate butyryltransferase [Rossellomorea marisflavi]KML34778.1 phosphate butyryltransferase [Rossellomorea marisflavi]KZE45711.1 phosphate butyryltransferase [Rossellomorea marisflavi]MCM2606439.1 phosphate butyryltransferase [Rossellomorea marisflavi]QHA36837.1 phosphate butyryltransferase [Rossellomorea marisflavi]